MMPPILQDKVNIKGETTLGEAIVNLDVISHFLSLTPSEQQQLADSASKDLED